MFLHFVPQWHEVKKMQRLLFISAGRIIERTLQIRGKYKDLSGMCFFAASLLKRKKYGRMILAMARYRMSDKGWSWQGAFLYCLRLYHEGREGRKMAENGKGNLFKDTINKSNYETRIKELSEALDAGDAAMKELLLGTAHPKRYEEAGGKYKRYKGTEGGLRADEIRSKDCSGINDTSTWEKGLFKCMFYWNRGMSPQCKECKAGKRFRLIGDYRIMDYEVPAFFKEEGVGNIDLILEGNGEIYAAEAKTYRQDDAEPLLRMIAEILTYTLGDPAPNETGVYRKAILFFEKTPAEDKSKEQLTPQEEEYREAKEKDSAIMELIRKAGISVFHLTDAGISPDGEQQYRICKL